MEYIERSVGILNKYLSVREESVRFCKNMQTDDFVLQVDYFVSPPKWHLAHTTWFFEEFVLKGFVDGYEVFDSEFSYLFNSYYNHVGDRTLRDQRGLISKPEIEVVYAYRNYVNQEVEKLLQHCKDDQILDIIEIGINHEQQHQELMVTDFKYNIFQTHDFPTYNNELYMVNTKSFDDKHFITIPEGKYEIGFEGQGFCYDNELGNHSVYLHEFEISNNLVKNSEYLEFIEDGGYEDFRFWLDEGWAWIQSNKLKCPLYWSKQDGEWFEFTLAGLKKLDPNAELAHVSFYEANAFANWKNMRLPTEFEWEVAADQFNWGNRWEWTNSAYLPYPKFKIADGAIGEYNGKFMINQMVLRGGSVATSGGHTRKTYRNFFHPNMQWQYSGIRLVIP